MQDLQVSRAGRDRMAPSKDASFLGKPSELAKGCPPQPHVTYLQCSLPKKKKKDCIPGGNCRMAEKELEI